jgi:aminoglycoside phosphotransferase (APT) family kinase protein
VWTPEELIVRKSDVDLRALADLVGRIFPPRGRCTIERTESGMSTQVYRIGCGASAFYLRIAEERAASLAPEVQVHEVLRTRGVRVPAVVHFEPFDERLERSVMVTAEIPGAPLAERPVDGATIEALRAAGRDLAVINSMPVHGFGWIRRETDAVGPLQAEHDTYRTFALEQVEDDLAFLGQTVLTAAETVVIQGTIEHYDAWLHVEQAWLAHGDFDVTHIYQHDGRYTGIIDFGEIRGAHQLYDLGHFNLHDGEVVLQMLLPALLEGYREVLPLPPDRERWISLVSVLIGVRTLARNLHRQPPNAYQRRLASAILRSIALLNS